jgi:hypothetical protein
VTFCAGNGKVAQTLDSTAYRNLRTMSEDGCLSLANSDYYPVGIWKWPRPRGSRIHDSKLPRFADSFVITYWQSHPCYKLPVFDFEKSKIPSMWPTNNSQEDQKGQSTTNQGQSENSRMRMKVVLTPRQRALTFCVICCRLWIEDMEANRRESQRSSQRPTPHSNPAPALIRTTLPHPLLHCQPISPRCQLLATLQKAIMLGGSRLTA